LKKIIALSAITLYVLFVAYYQIYKKEQGVANRKYDQKFFFDDKTLESLKITTPTESLTLRLRNGQWWVIEPIEYPADQEFIEKNLRIIDQTLVENIFKKNERDYYGFDPGLGKIEFSHSDGKTRSFILGREEAPQNRIYLFHPETKEILVVHNLWGQFFYHTKDMFFSKGLPIDGLQVKAVDFYLDQQKIWHVKASTSDLVEVLFDTQKKSLKKATLMWFFKQISEFTLKNLSALDDMIVAGQYTLRIETENGSTDYVFDEKLGEVHIPQKKLRARYNKSDLSALRNELKKVVEGD